MHCIKGVCSLQTWKCMNEIQFLFRAVERVSEITPDRWNLIPEIVQDCQNLTVSDECPKVYVFRWWRKRSHLEDSVVHLDLYETLKNVGLQSKEITVH